LTITGSAGIAGAAMSYTGGTAVVCDSSGNYSITVANGWTGTVTPSLSGYLFTPATLSFTDITGNMTAENFTAAAAPAAFSGYDFALSAGAFWEFSGAYHSIAQTAGSPSQSTSSNWKYVIVLGSPTTIAGLTAFPVQLYGTCSALAPAPASWKYLALNANQLLGSTDGTTFSTIFDAQTGKWPGGGFFFSFPKTSLTTATSGTIPTANPYISGTADIAGTSSNSSECQYFPGVGTVCGSTSAQTIIKAEDYRAGIGPVGYNYINAWTDDSGGIDSEGTITEYVGLTASSFTGQTNPLATISFENSSGQNITGVWLVADPAGKSGTWGSNLATTAIATGASQAFSNLVSGTYDYRVQFADQTYLCGYSTQVADGGSVTIPVPIPDLAIANTSGKTITTIFLVLDPAGVNKNWGSNNFIPNGTGIPTGTTQVFENVAPGAYDIQIWTGSTNYTALDFLVAAGQTVTVTVGN
jgi:hypothetical protein